MRDHAPAEIDDALRLPFHQSDTTRLVYKYYKNMYTVCIATRRVDAPQANASRVARHASAPSCGRGAAGTADSEPAAGERCGGSPHRVEDHGTSPYLT